MTIFTRDYSQRLRHFNKKQNNNAVKTETIGNTAEVTRFDKWFASSYTRLREKIRFFSMVDEDNFHNTYLFIREKIMGGEEKIENLEAYFFRCYRYKAMTEMRNENRYVHPEDDFFYRFSQEETEPYPWGLNVVKDWRGRIKIYQEQVLPTGVQDVHATLLQATVLTQGSLRIHGTAAFRGHEENQTDAGIIEVQQLLHGTV